MNKANMKLLIEAAQEIGTGGNPFTPEWQEARKLSDKDAEQIRAFVTLATGTFVAATFQANEEGGAARVAELMLKSALAATIVAKAVVA